jgi:hypothetical protein
MAGLAPAISRALRDPGSSPGMTPGMTIDTIVT